MRRGCRRARRCLVEVQPCAPHVRVEVRTVVQPPCRCEGRCLLVGGRAEVRRDRAGDVEHAGAEQRRHALCSERGVVVAVRGQVEGESIGRQCGERLADDAAQQRGK
eukprot:6203216-Prymnesium_polylepis.1